MVRFSPDATMMFSGVTGRMDGPSYINRKEQARYHVNIYAKYSATGETI
jgi:hypothetical protein